MGQSTIIHPAEPGEVVQLIGELPLCADGLNLRPKGRLGSQILVGVYRDVYAFVFTDFDDRGRNFQVLLRRYEGHALLMCLQGLPSNVTVFDRRELERIDYAPISDNRQLPRVGRKHNR